jgi:hypothetical protein
MGLISPINRTAIFFIKHFFLTIHTQDLDWNPEKYCLQYKPKEKGNLHQPNTSKRFGYQK